ncbi:hypothetical protein [Vulcanisaeta souniana]|uniref:Uncharacterized protein n=1 Tax=Vulcanisaeta souniana JCM 11219 TaxID=1293586 RepID=A0A830EG89_9CREN|nr:hypothetical protein [Vulcanisaeta souniana]BDR90991.1 hypothetical protein Vsou_00840 [Vulcanisaeta souniana JCM 11219]GGI79843.1 hypothetical protein GCM10007112_16000 [Vulcanisaeta souniana JCM 11219]
MNEEIQEYVVLVNFLFIVMTAIYVLVPQLILLFTNSVVAVAIGTIVWTLLAYTLVTRRGLWALIYAKVHSALTGIKVIGITRVERMLLVPYVITYAIDLLLSVLISNPLASIALRIISASPLIIMIMEFAIMPRLITNNGLEQY